MELLTRNGLGDFLNETRLLDRGVEIGALAGEFSQVIASAWAGREITLLDCWLPQSSGVYVDRACADDGFHNQNLRSCEELARRDPRIKLLRAFSPDASRLFPDESLDWIYLDANHSFVAARADLAAWWPKIRPGGLFAGHDYLDGYFPDLGLFGVRSAVNRFAREIHRRVSFSQFDGPFRSWYVRKPLAPLPPPERICILSGYDNALAFAGAIARKNHTDYCARHAYRYVCRTDGVDPSRPARWSKLRFIAEELAGGACDWLLWIDPDAVFVNGEEGLTSILDDTVDMIVPRTFGFSPEIHTGVFLVRNSNWSRKFLERWDRQVAFANHEWGEAAAMIHLHDLTVGPRMKPDHVPLRIGDFDVRRHVAVIPHRSIMAMPHLEGVPDDVLIAHLGDLPGTGDVRAAVLADWAARAE